MRRKWPLCLFSVLTTDYCDWLAVYDHQIMVTGKANCMASKLYPSDRWMLLATQFSLEAGIESPPNH